MNDRISILVDGMTLQLSNLDKPLFPDGFTKAELISYYAEIAPILLPHLADRPITRVRYPNGTTGSSFYEKNAPGHHPEWLRLIRVRTSQGRVDYVSADSAAALVWLANLAAIELHAPQWRTSEAHDSPDGIPLEGPLEPAATSLMIDLDPGPGVTPMDSAKAAILVATKLASYGLEVFPKSSGNKGLQLSIPISPTPCSMVVGFASKFAHLLSKEHPKLFTASVAPQARAGKTFIDYAQNAAARNTVCAYSVRGRETPTVAAPLTWDEVGAISSERALRYTPADVLGRVERLGDLWQSQHSPADRPSLPTDLEE